MANYKETNLSGTEYQRARLISITNDHSEPNVITFVEEKIRFIGNEHFHSDISQLTESLTPENATTQFNLLNPETNDVIGSATYQQLYVLLYSLYLHLAAERDNQQITSVQNPSHPGDPNSPQA